MPSETNPLLEPSTLPYQLPPFALIDDEHYLPAFEAGLAEQRAQIADILASDDEPSFANTMIALESSGQALRRVAAVFFNRSSSDSSEFVTDLEERLAPILSAHDDAIRLDPALYARISALHERRHDLGLDPQSVYLIERYYIEFTLAGAQLGDADKAALGSLNQQLSALTTRFEKNLLADTNELAVVVTDAAELDGLDAGEIAAAEAAAAERGLDAGYLLTLVLPTGHPALAALTDRALRERLMRASRSRGIRGNEFDTTALVLEIVRLRARRARLLGFPDHASTVTAGQTARTPEAVAAMLEGLAPAAAGNARAELAQLEAAAGASVESWDWAFYGERVRRERYDVDTAEMRPYFELERVLHDGVFFAASRLYGLRFEERHDLTAYHPDARVFEVFDDDDSPLGLYLGDYFTRDSKRGGAWMNALVSGSSLLGTPTVVVNNLNVPKPAAGEPALLTFDEVTTLFHEFGHALHGLFGQTVYPRFSGTNVFRDFVEFPSQVNEMWMLWPEVLENYAVHHETGERMPRELVERVTASATFNQGFATSEYLAAALLDQAWHRLDVEAADAVTDVAAFEAQALARVGLDLPAVPPRYSSSYFAHTFSGGYDAGYYSYIWSEVLDADTVEWFRENGGLTRANGDRFREIVLGVGGSTDPLEAYRRFRGRDAAIEPLLVRRGLDV
ncbi:M3 family metallopeptidase [Compostimonas suwonensis]|uniref:Peptidyl-dipeptidase Dcp n=1 Tax=Compostimonas suwonensis TaxID=1048394 RepID=A0A2M9BZG4_9MICO|nr:M3 family metallopeptidase [Compostimonas suwonensis]PJJ63471.1 peptidyl-dipeptidase Dcp [Compostimonas suwonensis]